MPYIKFGKNYYYYTFLAGLCFCIFLSGSTLSALYEQEDPLRSPHRYWLSDEERSRGKQIAIRTQDCHTADGCIRTI
jgi:hypothetical protein